MEGDRNIKCIVLLGCTCTKSWFLEYIITITCRSTYGTSVHASGLGETLYGNTLPLKLAPESTQSTALEQMRKGKHLS